MKRSITELDHSVTMANCLMLLSRGNDYDSLISTSTSSSSPSRVFECKTCNRQFPSFQALGGHRASHKKPRLAGGDSSSSDSQSSSPSKPKTHECNICGLEFAIGQALGGHMRRHRAAVADNHNDHRNNNGVQLNSMMGLNSNPGQGVVPVLKKTDISRRILCLDLNLTPFENDMKILGIGKTTPPLVEFIF
ncbi:zinc finger protein ZAT12-like [Argentina anserina]|uniref:zinc finger protein ZAT12-like n=1 Tax=Argentina anserina TaxID=57926 RepID=UPI0021769239|nr:zinc finger protein ZAT12-like [Potentilla anserina]